MPAWLHRTTKQYIPSSSPASMAKSFDDVFVDADGAASSNVIAILDPDLSAVTGFESKYWITQVFPDDAVTLEDQATRDSIDVAEIVASRDALADDIDRNETFLKAFALVVLDEFNNLRSQHGLAPRTISQLKTAVRNKLDA